MKRMLALGAAALALGGCAGYYDPYGGYGYNYGAYPDAVYAAPAYDTYYYGQPWYAGPSGSVGFYYYDNDGNRHWRERGNDGRWSDHRWNGNYGRGPGGHGNYGSWHERQGGGPGARGGGRDGAGATTFHDQPTVSPVNPRQDAAGG
jgi:hypothetical protein